MRIVIIGASGGIGAAFVSAYASAGHTVHALSRRPVEGSSAHVHPGRIDLSDEDSIATAASDIGAQGAPDLVIVASGILSNSDGLQPEKSMRQQGGSAFEQVFAVNTIGPALVAKHFIPIMPRKERAVFAALSARVGSISDNRLGGWHAYRASKAALNMLIRNYAIEQARRNDQFIAVGLHPGTVDTALSKPFQGNVPDGKLFTPERSASALIGVIEGLTPEASGKVFDWAGVEVPA
ncbi:MAG: SDR family NAD(P)-dependent oxidoreductase [Henriciella sp.]|nr:SDR family NAD(P)-dependent oxidoreductase [Henriciella sp.]